MSASTSDETPTISEFTNGLTKTAPRQRLVVTGSKTQPVLQAILDVNRSGGPVVDPPHVTAAENEWRSEPTLEFYVDFETVTDLDDDFSQIPKRGGQPLIFMIGCGHVEQGSWQFRLSTVDTLTEVSEAAIIDARLAHMRGVAARLCSTGIDPLVIHGVAPSAVEIQRRLG